MQQNNNPNHNYDAAYLQAYANGLLLPLQMHALEKEALNNIFLAEALEGYMLLHAKTTNASEPIKKTGPVETLKINSAFKFNFKTIAAAASIFLVLAVGGYLLIAKKQNMPEMVKNIEPTLPTIKQDSITKQQNLAVEEIKIADTILAKPLYRPGQNPIIIPAANVPTDIVFTPITKNAEVAKENFFKKQMEVAQGVGVDSVSAKTAVAINENKSFNDVGVNSLPREKAGKKIYTEPTANADTLKKYNSNKDAAVNTQAPTQVITNGVQNNAQQVFNTKPRYGDKVNYNGNAINNVNKPNQNFAAVNQGLLNKFNGRVVTNNNKPIPFAHITLAEKGIDTYADQGGYYNFESIDTNLVLNVSGQGLGVNKLKIKPARSNLIVLEGLDATDDVTKEQSIVKKEANAKRGDKKLADIVTLNKTYIFSRIYNNNEPNPTVSSLLYETYLNNNSIFASSLKTLNKKAGTITLSFIVNANGQPTTFKIINGLTKMQNNDIIRLIENGPLWNTNSNNKIISLSIIAL